MFKPKIQNFIFNIRARNIIIFTQNKSTLNYFKSLVKCLRKESLFKTKGFIFKRTLIRRRMPRSIIFARRIKIKKLKLKLSKKQKLI
jgi:hypothetical protein